MVVALLLWTLLPNLAASDFARDVIQKAPQPNYQMQLNRELLSKATPAKEFYAARGLEYLQNGRRLEEENDDFYIDYDDRYSFSGYSLKYAKCQPLQYFSSDAIAAGQHSPMITEDVVMLRLCPQTSCSTSVEYGCHYNYAEYAIAVGDYIHIMLKYKSIKLEKMCEWCAACGVVYQGNGDGDDDAGGRRRLEDQAAGDDVAQNEAADDAGQDDAVEQNDDNVQGDNNNNNDCYDVDSICEEYDEYCGEEGGEYANYEGYLNYMHCAEVEYNGYAYFVRPRCDGSKGTITMAVYYDNYCGSYAGEEVSIKQLGLGFKESVFEDFYTGECIDCSETNEAPYYSLNSALCNQVHASSAKCTSDLLYDVVDSDEDESTECSFIESLRYGTYDSSGKLSSGSNLINWDTEVSPVQKALLAGSAFLCVVFVIYACYLHHSMTNLLIKSLSHRELLPPGRHRNRKGSRGGEDDYKLV